MTGSVTPPPVKKNNRLILYLSNFNFRICERTIPEYHWSISFEKIKILNIIIIIINQIHFCRITFLKQNEVIAFSVPVTFKVEAVSFDKPK